MGEFARFFFFFTLLFINTITLYCCTAVVVLRKIGIYGYNTPVRCKHPTILFSTLLALKTNIEFFCLKIGVYIHKHYVRGLVYKIGEKKSASKPYRK